MKNTIIGLSIILLCTSCIKNKNIHLDAEEFYIIEINNSYPLPNDTLWTFVLGVTEIEKDFEANRFFKKNHYTDNYYMKNIEINDSLKTNINGVLLKYSKDTLFEGEPLIYDGPVYLFLVKKDSRYIRYMGIPRHLPYDLNEIRKALIDNKSSSKIGIQEIDSLKRYLCGFQKFVFDEYLPPITVPNNYSDSIYFIPPSL